jgi:drug/metabolite transporter (DMT)-like permease
LLARLQILAAAVLMSTGGAAIKSATVAGMEVAAARSIIAAALLLLLSPARHAIRDPRAAAVGAAIAITMVSFVGANKLTTAANTIFLQYAGSLYVLVLAPRVLGERLSRRDVPFIVVLVAGLAAFLVDAQTPSATAPRPQLGNLLAMLSGVSWAAVIVGLRVLAARTASQHAPERPGLAEAASVWGNLFAFAAGLPWIIGDFDAVVANGPVLAYLGVFQVGIAYLSFSAGVRHVTAPEASLLLLVEPALNPVWAWLVHGERPGNWAIAGGAVILGATAVRTAFDARARATNRKG